ncbi:Abi-alpha family protein [Halomonas sp. BM-2019]|uniref:Abi-alpha family protein n=1 Tax=Halomonas sp. BM-2019 TaxID=2811227 RepID=UPI001B3C4A89|nr:MAG: DUF4393 domain-containing protein [Halomonas sp. BM-2019]
MADDTSLDLTGIGKLAKAVPPSAWNRLVKTACDTFTQLIAPITATTYGLGMLIEAKFDGMADAQKVLAADAVRRATVKVENAGKTSKGNPKAIVLVRAIEAASNETDDNVRGVWANLIANELIENDVHPEFTRILERLSSKDAAVLAEIGERAMKDPVKRAVRAVSASVGFMGINIAMLLEEEADFSRVHLEHLNLIAKYSGQWALTVVGEEFLKAVADPTFEAMTVEQADAPDGASRRSRRR